MTTSGRYLNDFEFKAGNIVEEIHRIFGYLENSKYVRQNTPNEETLRLYYFIKFQFVDR
jgi:hypothetical protein